MSSSSSSSKPPVPGITNSHSVNIEYPGGSEENIRQSIKNFIQGVEDYCKENRIRKIDRRFFLNYMKKKNSSGKIVPSYCGFIYFRDPILYYVSLGLDVDGSKLVEYIPDPNWKPKVTKDNKKLSWGDMVTNNETPYVAVDKEPIVDPLSFTDEFGDEKEILVRAARVTPAKDPEYDFHVLFSIVPIDIDDRFLLSIFRLFSSTRGFPRINSIVMNNRAQKKVYVSYDSGTHDAQFALQLTRVLPVRSKSKEEFYLNFSHARSRQAKNND